jgi:hypothetical protein
MQFSLSRRYLRALWRDTLVLIRQFRVSILIFVVMA